MHRRCLLVRRGPPQCGGPNGRRVDPSAHPCTVRSAVCVVRRPARQRGSAVAACGRTAGCADAPRCVTDCGSRAPASAARVDVWPRRGRGRRSLCGRRASHHEARSRSRAGLRGWPRCRARSGRRLISDRRKSLHRRSQRALPAAVHLRLSARATAPALHAADAHGRPPEQDCAVVMTPPSDQRCRTNADPVTGVVKRCASGETPGPSKGQSRMRVPGGACPSRVDLADLEAQTASDLAMRDATLEHEAAHMAFADCQMLGDAAHIRVPASLP